MTAQIEVDQGAIQGRADRNVLRAVLSASKRLGHLRDRVAPALHSFGRKGRWPSVKKPQDNVPRTRKQVRVVHLNGLPVHTISANAGRPDGRSM